MGHAIAIFGGTGIGKTTWAAGITKPELTRVIAFEGLQKGIIPPGVHESGNVRDVMKKYDPFEPESIRDAESDVRKELKDAARDAKAGKIRVLVLDGANALHDGACVYSMERYPNSTQQRAVLEQSILRPMMLSLRRIDCLVILLAHEASRYEKNTTGERRDAAPIGVQAAVGGGGMREKLGSYVDDIWHMEQKGQKRTFTTQGTGDAGADAKSRLKAPDGSPLLPSRNVLVEDAARALRLYMGWSKPKGQGAGEAGENGAGAGKPTATAKA